MIDKRRVAVLGLMSGTALDGVDIAAIRTDGEADIDAVAFRTYPYCADDRACLEAGILAAARMSPSSWIHRADWAPAVVLADRLVTTLHISTVRRFLATTGFKPSLIGFHGQTVMHRPDLGMTVQLGDAAELASALSCPTVGSFRHRDMAHGGQGAPLIPLYHAVLARDLPRPLAVLNLGGVANVTYLGNCGEVMAFDVGPGNALIDDWVRSATSLPYDIDGKIAASGRVDASALTYLLEDSFFARMPPKSLDRLAFDSRARAVFSDVALADVLATLVAFTARSVARATDYFPQNPRQWLVAGGGRHNHTLMVALRTALSSTISDTVPDTVSNTVEKPLTTAHDTIIACDTIDGWAGDAIEAQAFAWLAVRSQRGLPLSLPTTTGVSTPQTGGRLFMPLQSRG